MNVGTIRVGFCAFRNNFERSAEITQCARKVSRLLSGKTTLEIGRSKIGGEFEGDAVGLDSAIEVAFTCHLVAKLNIRSSRSIPRFSREKLRRSDKSKKANTKEDRLAHHFS